MSETKNAPWLKLTGLAGILTPVIALVFIGLAIASNPSFNWTTNALSDLGVVQGATSTLFNFGLFLNGLLALIFSVGLFILFRKSIIGKVGSGIFFLASLALVGIAVFTEDMPPFHVIFSVAFFVLMPISLLVIAGFYLKTRQMQMAAFTSFVAVAAAVPWVLEFTVPYVSGVAVPEAISAAAGSVWAVVLGYNMLKEASHAKSS